MGRISREFPQREWPIELKSEQVTRQKRLVRIVQAAGNDGVTLCQEEARGHAEAGGWSRDGRSRS